MALPSGDRSSYQEQIIGIVGLNASGAPTTPVLSDANGNLCAVVNNASSAPIPAYLTATPTATYCAAGKGFSAGIGATVINTTAEFKAVLVINPAGSGKILKVGKWRFSSYVASGPGSAGSVYWRVYIDPTITANGTAITPVPARQTNNTSVCQFYSSPTSSANGTFARGALLSVNTNEEGIDEEYGFWLEPGHEMLITVQNSSSGGSVQMSFIFAEE